MTMQETINKNMLRHHVSTAMFCPKCETVLDVSRAVSIDRMKDGELERTYILCAKCWDEVKLALNDAMRESGRTLEVTDGRELFGRKR